MLVCGRMVLMVNSVADIWDDFNIFLEDYLKDEIYFYEN